MNEYIFIKFPIDLFVKNEVYPFDIFIKNKDIRFFALNSFEKVSDENYQEIKGLCQQGGYLQIFYQDFLDYKDDYKKSDKIENENKQLISLIEKSKENYQLKKQMGHFSFSEELEKAVENDDFSTIIARAKHEISLFSLTQSTYQSSLIKMLNKMLIKDYFLTRGAAFTYFFAKRHGIKNELLLLEICLAYMLKDIGYSQIPLNSQKAESELAQKHTIYSYYVLKKLPFEFSKRFKLILLDHDGSIQNKNRKSISEISSIIAICDHLFNHSFGKLADEDVNLYRVMNAIIHHGKGQGIQYKFLAPVKATLASLQL